MLYCVVQCCHKLGLGARPIACWANAGPVTVVVVFFHRVLLPPGRSLRVDFFLFPTRSNTTSTKFDLKFEVLQFFYEEKERSKFAQTESRNRSDETILTNVPPCCERMRCIPTRIHAQPLEGDASSVGV